MNLTNRMEAIEIANELYARAKQRTTREEFRPFDLMTEQEKQELFPMKVGICYQFHYVCLFGKSIQKVRSGTYVLTGGTKPMISGTTGRKVMEF